jgi:hypothetical protein
MQHRALWGAKHSERAVESRELLLSDAELLDGGLRPPFGATTAFRFWPLAVG